jgi:hypothetical protein
MARHPVRAPRHTPVVDWVNVIGLGLGLVGTCVAASGLIVTKREAIDLGVGRWAGSNDEENLKLPAVRDRLKQRRNTIVGLTLIALGFTLQLIAAWPG